MIIKITKNVLTFLGIFILFSVTGYAQQAAQQVLERSLGADIAARFELSIVDGEGENDWFEIQVRNNNIQVKGNSQVALSKGAYSYIKQNGLGVVTWEGSNVHIPAMLEDNDYPRVTSSMPLRMYVNPVTYGYTMAWWSWDRWEQELDWMALHGINMPVALLGQEIIWQQVWEEIGIASTELADYHTGPGFLPWFRMGNIYQHFGPLPQSWMDKDKQLQQRILDRMRTLGMQPIVPAFSGHVPPKFNALYPNSKTYPLENWGGLETEKASILLDPKDPMFSKIGLLFLKKYEEAYGKSNLFLADAFNEMLPPVSEEGKEKELAEYGDAIYKSIREYDKDATWVIQGWTFGHQSAFWDADATQSFFSRIPKDNLLMLNYGEDRYPIWEKLDAFYGFKWTYGYVHNYGGQQSLFGDLDFYYESYRDLMDDSDKGNLVGYGVLPEAIENNSVVYEYIFDVPWGATDKPVNHWVSAHMSNRYGKLTSNVKQAWDIALDNTYTLKEWRGVGSSPLMNWLDDNVFNKYGKLTETLIAIDNFFSSLGENADKEEADSPAKPIGLGYGTYIHNNRPTLIDVDPDDYIGNPASIKDVLNLLIQDLPQYQDSELYYYDIVDFAQHYTAYKADVNLLAAIQLYKDGQHEKGDKAFAKTKEFLWKLEQLQVLTGGSFAKWCQDAVALATTDEERALYLQNAKAQITIWGGNRLKDYASKSWAGILIDFYVPRWEMFFDELKASNGEFDQAKAQKNVRLWEEEWVNQSHMPKDPERLTKAQSLALIKQILADD